MLGLRACWAARCRSGPREKREGAAEGVGRAGLPGPSGGESEGGLGWSLGRDGLGFGLKGWFQGVGLGFLFWFFFLFLHLFLSKTNLLKFKQSFNSTTLCTQANKVNAPA